jgi:hypothetical protein
MSLEPFAHRHHQTLELLEGRKLFDPVDGRGQYQLPIALAQYIAYLGLPPLAMIRQSPLFRIFFDQYGEFEVVTLLDRHRKLSWDAH